MSREHPKGCIPSRIMSPWLSSSFGIERIHQMKTRTDNQSALILMTLLMLVVVAAAIYAAVTAGPSGFPLMVVQLTIASAISLVMLIGGAWIASHWLRDGRSPEDGGMACIGCRWAGVILGLLGIYSVFAGGFPVGVLVAMVFGISALTLDVLARRLGQARRRNRVTE
jgi:peptidoglycan/LPS O-acetylase OafA/YrhL